MEDNTKFQSQAKKYLRSHDFDSIKLSPFPSFSWWQLLLLPVVAWILYQGMLYGLSYFLGHHENFFNFLSGLTNLLVFGAFFWFFGLRSKKLTPYEVRLTPVDFGSKRWLIGAMIISGILLVLRITLIVILLDIFPSLSPGPSSPAEPTPFLIDFIVIAILVPIGEELFFRGLLYKGLRQKTTIGWAILISSIFFGVAHFSLLQGITAFISGFVMAYFYEKSESFYIPLLMHVINNGVIVVLYHFL